MKIISKVPLVKRVVLLVHSLTFKETIEYWEKRYDIGGTSGKGSFGKYAKFKADILNRYVKENSIKSVIEFGCGDGNQLSYFDFPSYIGLDVSQAGLSKCIIRFEKDKTKRFFLYNPSHFIDNKQIFKADMALSLDVIYHLIEDHIYIKYMNDLFNSATKYVIIYSSDFEQPKRLHVRHRNFTKYVADNFPEWELTKKLKNIHEGALVHFFIFNRCKNY